jgi:diguanylate cyclase (GGDEF)-like protein
MRVKPAPESADPLEGACLVVIDGPRLGQCVEVHDVPVVIGRSPEADFEVDHASVSRFHCAIWLEKGRVFMRDLGSKNGSWVNGARVAHAELFPGDHIALGDAVLKLVPLDSLEARYHEALYQLATVDSLTQLSNRREFRAQVGDAIARAQAENLPLALVMIDLDRFKQVNDRYGHGAGDDVLRAVTQTTRQRLRPGDAAGRLGGDEFAVLLRDCDLAEALQWCEKLRGDVAALRFVFGGTPVAVTISLGVAQLRADLRNVSELMHAADAALLRTKGDGRNRVGAALAAT